MASYLMQDIPIQLDFYLPFTYTLSHYTNSWTQVFPLMLYNQSLFCCPFAAGKYHSIKRSFTYYLINRSSHKHCF